MTERNREQNTAEEESVFDVGGRRENVLCCLTNLLLVTTFYLVVECLYLEDTGRILAGALVPAGFLLFEEWMGWRRPGFGVYWGLHAAALALLAAAALNGIGPVDAVTIGAVLFVTGLGSYSRVRELRFCHPGWPEPVIGILEYAAGFYIGLPLLQRTGQAVIIAGSVLWILWQSVAGIENALSALHTKARVPREQILRSHRLVTGISLGAFAVLAVPSVLSSFGESVLRIILNGINALLEALASLIRMLLHWLNQDTVEETAGTAQEETQMMMGLGEEAVSEPNVFLETLTNLLFAAILIALAYSLIRLLVLLFQKFRADFARTKRMDGDKVEALRPGEKNERASFVRTAERRRFWDRSPNARIRKLYRKMILAGAGADKVRGSHTPRELETVSLGETADTGRVHEIYEKARYSGTDCTQEEAALVRERLKDL